MERDPEEVRAQEEAQRQEQEAQARRSRAADTRRGVGRGRRKRTDDDSDFSSSDEGEEEEDDDDSDDWSTRWVLLHATTPVHWPRVLYVEEQICKCTAEVCRDVLLQAPHVHAAASAAPGSGAAAEWL